MRALALCLVALVACGDGADTPDAAATARLSINELMPSNKAACADVFGEYDDWIELYNAGDTDVELAGYTLTDDVTEPTKAVLAGGTVPAHGVALLWADDQVQGLDHLPFKLSADGEVAALFAPDGTLVDSVTFGAATTDQSFARAPDGDGEFVTCATPTCGALNGADCSGSP